MQIRNNEEYKAITIEKLGLSTRTFNCLKRVGINTLYLIVDNYNALPIIRNMGAKSLTEIDELLYKMEIILAHAVQCLLFMRMDTLQWASK